MYVKVIQARLGVEIYQEYTLLYQFRISSIDKSVESPVDPGKESQQYPATDCPS